jgi:hypothetical protein
VGDEQHAPGAHAFGVEGGEPGLAEAGGEHDEAAPVAVAPCGFERGEAWDWIGVGSGGGLGFLAAGRDGARRRDAALFVGVDPASVSATVRGSRKISSNRARASRKPSSPG